MKSKMTLHDLKVKSFVTGSEGAAQVKGGRISAFGSCYATCDCPVISFAPCPTDEC